MAIKALNSVAGFSVGEVPANIILANGDITSNNGNFTANISAGNVKTDNLLYANGTPWDLGGLPGGSNTYIQFNDAGEFGGSANFTFNSSTNVLTVTGNISGTNVNAGNLLTANYVTGTLTTAAQPNITSVGNLTGLTVTDGTSNSIVAYGNGLLAVSGNITASNFVGNISGNISGNIVIPGANTGVVFNDGGNANTSTAFTFDKTSNLVTITANANVGNLISDGVVSATGNVSGANLTTGGVVSATGNVSGGNLTTGGAVVATGNVTGGNLTTAGVLSVTGNANVGNLGTAEISATANITGANLITGGLVSATGNVSGGNLTTAGAVDATGNVSGGNITTAGVVSATGNVTGGNLTTGGIVEATGNVNGANFNTSGTANIGNLKIANVVEGNLIPSISNTYSLGNGTNYWKDLFLSGSTITIGDQTIGSNSSGISLSNTTFLTTLDVSGNANVGNLGTAGLIVATGNVTGGNLTTGGVVDATGNVSGGNLTTAGAISATGNANVGNLGTGGLIIATGNITGGNLSTGGALSVTGDANVGNLGTSGIVIATGNITGGNIITGGAVEATGNVVSNANVVTDLIVGRTSSVTITATGSNQNINLTPTGTGTVNVGNFIISNVATPVADYDAATKKYVDDIAQGLNIHDAVAAATPDTLANITVGTITYNNGANGVGANLTTTGSFDLIDGVNVQTSGTRILVKNEANAAYNGIYTWTNATVITRAADFNSVPEVEAGDFTFVTGGTTYDNTGWVQTDDVTTIGTDPIYFTQFSGAGAYTAGTGLALNGGEFSIANTTVTAGSYGNGDSVATFTVNGQGQLSAAANVVITANAANLTGTTLASSIVNTSITSVGTLGSLDVTANITAGNVYANSGTIGASLLGGTLTTAAQPNVTSVGTLTSLSVTGNISGGNISTGGELSVTGNATTANLSTGGVTITGGGSITGANLVSANYVTGTLTTNAQPNVTSVGTLTGLDVNGTVTAQSFTANTGIFTGNAAGLTDIPGANVTGTVANATHASTANTVTDAAQSNITSVGTLTGLVVGNNSANVTFNTSGNGSLTATGNITAANFVGNVVGNISGNITIPGSNTGVVFNDGGSANTSTAFTFDKSSNLLTVTGNIDGANLTTGGVVAATGNVSGGNLTTSGAVVATGNVSGGNISTSGLLSVTGTANIANLNVSTTANLGAVGNVTITGGSNGYVLQTDGAGVLSWVGISSSSISNGNSNVSIPSANGNVNISAVGNANVVVVTGTGLLVNGDGNITGNLTAGNIVANGGSGGSITGANLVSANYFTGTLTTAAQPNITSVGTLTSLDVTGNVTSGNVYANSGIIGALTLIGEGGNISNIQGANVSGAVGTATVAGTVTTAAQPNITSVGTLTSLAVTGNVSGGNISTGGVLSVTGNANVGNLITEGVVVANSGIQISNSAVYVGNLTTTSTSANQTIATLQINGTYATGVEYLVKGIDSTGTKYSVATVVAVTNGSTADYSTFATVNLGGSTGTLAVNITTSGGNSNIALQVTPASSNSTVWTTQYRVI